MFWECQYHLSSRSLKVLSPETQSPTPRICARQEYLGSYVSDEAGRLVFREGALVTAVRRGHWLVLDELNLAPSEVLEALNRRALLFTGPRPTRLKVLLYRWYTVYLRVSLGIA